MSIGYLCVLFGEESIQEAECRAVGASGKGRWGTGGGGVHRRLPMAFLKLIFRETAKER